MAIHRQALPQLGKRIFLTDAGLETDLIFNHGAELPAFAAHTLLEHDRGREQLTQYFDSFLRLAHSLDAGFIMDVPTWRAQRHFAQELNVSPESLADTNHQAVEFSANLRREHAANSQPIVLNAVIGPKGDAYVQEEQMTPDEATRYHSEQINWLKDTEADMITALTFTNSAEAIGVVRAANMAAIPVAVSFTVETDGCLPSGQRLDDAIEEVDAATGQTAAYFMINCAHPTHFAASLDSSSIRNRIRGLRCNASKMSHEELDCCEQLDDGNPIELAADYQKLMSSLPNLCVIGGCCGTDLRHVKAIAETVVAH